MIQEISFGAVIFYNNKYLLIKHAVGSHWDFPKGHQEKNETPEQTALREIKEETGLTVKLIPNFSKTISYLSEPNVKKSVTFFLATTKESSVKICQKEIIDYVWLPYTEALVKLTYPQAKEVLNNAHRFNQDKHN